MGRCRAGLQHLTDSITDDSVTDDSVTDDSVTDDSVTDDSITITDDSVSHVVGFVVAGGIACSDTLRASPVG